MPVRTFHISGRVMNAQTFSPSSEAEVTLLSDQGETVFSPGERLFRPRPGKFRVPRCASRFLRGRGSTTEYSERTENHVGVDLRRGQGFEPRSCRGRGQRGSGRQRPHSCGGRQDRGPHQRSPPSQYGGNSGLAGSPQRWPISPPILTGPRSIPTEALFSGRFPKATTRLVVFSIPEGFYLKSSGATDVLETGITVSRGHSPPALELVLTPGAGRIEGTLERDEHRFLAAWWCWCRTERGAAQPNDYQEVLSDQSGGFRDYRILFPATTRFSPGSRSREAPTSTPNFLRNMKTVAKRSTSKKAAT